MHQTFCFIKCNDCHQIFQSRLYLGTRETYLTSTLAENRIECPKCGRMTDCNKENMTFNDGEGGIVHGAATIPSP